MSMAGFVLQPEPHEGATIYSGMCLKGLARLSPTKGSLLTVQISVSCGEKVSLALENPIQCHVQA
jgi:hypothetical protein